VPPSERRARSRPPEEPIEVEAYRQLLASDDRQQPSHRWLKGGAVLAAVGIGGWLWRRKYGSQASKPAPTQGAGPSA
jgi:hypothetical protein